jgi:hypothetical protein
VRAVQFERRGAGARVEIRPGRRFELEACLRAAFELARPADWVRTRALVFGPRAASPRACGEPGGTAAPSPSARARVPSAARAAVAP